MKLPSRLSMLALFAGTTFGQVCQSYTLDYNGCSYEYYPSGGSSCSCALRFQSEQNTIITPGFLSEKRNGRYVVASVFPESVAEAVGVAKDDEILAWNGLAISDALVGQNQTWGETSVRVVLGHRGRRTEVTLPLVSVSSLIDKRWKGLNSSFRADSHDYSPFVFGLEMIQRNGEWVVSSVLSGGPADRAGMRVGDIVARAHSLPEEEPLADLRLLLRPDYRMQVRLSVTRACDRLEFVLEADSFSDVMRQSAPVKEAPVDVETMRRLDSRRAGAL